jgi:hypothetical protein
LLDLFKEPLRVLLELLYLVSHHVAFIQILVCFMLQLFLLEVSLAPQLSETVVPLLVAFYLNFEFGVARQLLGGVSSEAL